MTGISIVYITNRKEPQIEWFFSSLFRQYKGQVPIEIIVVDFYAKLNMSAIDNGIEIKYVKPLPSHVQGEYKITSIDWWSASNARNTGFVYSRYDYVVFVDDLSVLMPTWFNAVLQAQKENYCVLGIYEKRNKIIVEDGILISSEEIRGGKDSRLPYLNYDRTPAPASWFYGASFGIPIEYALKLNGFDCICDLISAEDTHFGERLKRTGCPMYVDKNMQTIESDELHFGEGQYFKRESFPVSKDYYSKLLHEYNISDCPERTDDKYDAVWFTIDLLRNSNQITSFGNNFDLRMLRYKAIIGDDIAVEDMKLPTQFWFTKQNFSEL